MRSNSAVSAALLYHENGHAGDTRNGGKDVIRKALHEACDPEKAIETASWETGSARLTGSNLGVNPETRQILEACNVNKANNFHSFSLVLQWTRH